MTTKSGAKEKDAHDVLAQEQERHLSSVSHKKTGELEFEL